MGKEQTIKELAFEILKKKESPLHYKEITALIRKKKNLTGRTPWKTVNARLCTSSKFKKIGKGRKYRFDKKKAILQEKFMFLKGFELVSLNPFFFLGNNLFIKG